MSQSDDNPLDWEAFRDQCLTTLDPSSPAEPSPAMVPQADDWIAIENELTRKVAEMLDRNPQKLLSALYRIDVAQSQVDRVFRSDSAADIPRGLAKLIIQREREKALSRAKYQAEGAE